MTVPFLCIVIMSIVLIASKFPVAIAMNRLKNGYDNCYPRDQQAELVGWGKRALAAHKNAFEAYPIFVAGVLMSHLMGADLQWAMILSLTHVAMRISYHVLYIANVHVLRSLVWGVAYFCSLGLMVLALI